MSDSWDDYAGEWDTNPDAIAYSQKAFDALRGITALEGKEVFDFGCGTGLLTARMAPLAASIVALDTSPAMIEVLRAKNLPNVTALSQPLEELLKADEAKYTGCFDLVTASSVCAFVPDYSAVLGYLHTMLKPGGRLVQWDWFSPTDSGHPGFTEGQIASAIEATGFRLAGVSRAFTMPGQDGEATVLMAVAKKKEGEG